MHSFSYTHATAVKDAYNVGTIDRTEGSKNFLKRKPLLLSIIDHCRRGVLQDTIAQVVNEYESVFPSTLPFTIDACCYLPKKLCKLFVATVFDLNDVTYKTA